MIIVTHRLSTINFCDKIILLQDGKIAAQGSYDELKVNNEEFEFPKVEPNLSSKELRL